MDKRQVILWGGLVALGAVLGLSGFNAFQVGIYRDDAIYTVLTHSLLYTDHFGVEELSGHTLGATYPFGYPLLLAPVAILFPGNLGALKALSLVFTLANAAILFWGWPHLVRGSSRWWGAAIGGLYALSPVVLGHATMVMSEAAFTFFTLLALLLAERYRDGRPGWRWSPVLGVVMAMVVFTRTVGIALLGAIFIYLIYHRRRQVLAPLALASLAALAVVIVVVLLTPIDRYDLLPGRYLQDSGAELLSNSLTGEQSQTSSAPFEPADPAQAGIAADREGKLGQLIYDYLIDGSVYHFGLDYRQAILPGVGVERLQSVAARLGFPALPYLLGIAITGVMFIGMGWLIWQRQATGFIWFALAYLGILHLWIWNGPRLLYPVLPQMQFGFLVGLHVVTNRLAKVVRAPRPEQWGRLITVGAVAMMLVISIYRSADIRDSRAHVGDLQQRTAWLTQNSAPSVRVMSESAEVDYIYGGRRTVPYLEAVGSPAKLAAYLATLNVQYVLIAPEIAWQDTYRPVLSGQAQQLLTSLNALQDAGSVALAFHSPVEQIWVYRVTMEGSTN